MNAICSLRNNKKVVVTGLSGLALMVILLLQIEALAQEPSKIRRKKDTCSNQSSIVVETQQREDLGSTWYWLRSPEEEKRVVISLFNRYCIRCHGVDGRGVWDIPDVPDFTNARWQASRSDAQLSRLILEGRGAVMPPFRGAMTLEESWAMARYLRTFLPGTETPRPDLRQPEKPATTKQVPDTIKPAPAKGQ